VVLGAWGTQCSGPVVVVAVVDAVLVEECVEVAVASLAMVNASVSVLCPSSPLTGSMSALDGRQRSWTHQRPRRHQRLHIADDGRTEESERFYSCGNLKCAILAIFVRRPFFANRSYVLVITDEQRQTAGQQNRRRSLGYPRAVHAE